MGTPDHLFGPFGFGSEGVDFDHVDPGEELFDPGVILLTQRRIVDPQTVSLPLAALYHPLQTRVAKRGFNEHQDKRLLRNRLDHVGVEKIDIDF